MKKVLTILAAVLLTASVFAQAPQKMTYQAVVRDDNSTLIISTQVGIEINIYQGSATGTLVYTEIQTPITNVNGLLSIEIGGQTGFDTITWANGPYFLETNIDPDNSGTYTITGVSQLLTVPYALHAKTAESITGGINETDPVYSSSQAANITATDITNLGNLSGTNTGDQQISRTGLTVTLTNGGTYQDSINTYIAGDGIDITGTTISETKYQVGDFAQGGIVFWVDETGEHGLVCAKSDQDGGSGVRWFAGTYGNTQAKGDGPYAGEANTSIIIAAQVAIGDDGNTYAARICNELQITEGGKTYGDWYLPSKEELNLMYQNKATIDATATTNSGSGFASAYYWSSTEYNINFAWLQGINTGSQGYSGKYGTGLVRAVRAF